MFLYYHLFVYFYKNAEDKGKFFSISKLQKKFRNRIYFSVYKKKYHGFRSYNLLKRWPSLIPLPCSLCFWSHISPLVPLPLTYLHTSSLLRPIKCINIYLHSTNTLISSCTEVELKLRKTVFSKTVVTSIPILTLKLYKNDSFI